MSLWTRNRSEIRFRSCFAKMSNFEPLILAREILVYWYCSWRMSWMFVYSSFYPSRIHSSFRSSAAAIVRILLGLRGCRWSWFLLRTWRPTSPTHNKKSNADLTHWCGKRVPSWLHNRKSRRKLRCVRVFCEGKLQCLNLEVCFAFFGKHLPTLLDWRHMVQQHKSWQSIQRIAFLYEEYYEYFWCP